MRWRIGAVYRAGCFLELIKGFYKRDSIPVQCVLEALGGVMRACEAEHLMIQDYEYLCNVYGSMFNVFRSQLYCVMDQLPSLKSSDLEAFIHILDHATNSGLLDKSTLGFEARFDDIRGHAREVSAVGVNRALPLLMMTDEIEKLLRKRFGEPVLGQLDLNALFVQVVVLRFISDVRNSRKRLYELSMNGPTPDIPIQDLFALYRRTAMLLGIYDAACPG
ncbi:hypothetical protein M378DRAFT_19106 [Amanita muscaria Koide BX008]|uniref:Uncharacterized protein n=1 Tax=Amanita muscaria (strain Koide BX008) TaxID=946122 RepID=A0A0C2WC26_AMAMK|nr:hypothetical protein M378DRAFT_19182 [Amanita muscaria Koide BX008]KIL54235.1 hypothetical protein M378DRAFT_19106 [Amanita muscaria Koide BX008]